MGPPAHYAGLSLSPQGDTIVGTVCESIDCEDPTATNFVRKYNLMLMRKDGSQVRFTNGQAVAATPVWSPRGDEIVFGSTRSGHMDLYRRPLTSSIDIPLLPPGPDRGTTAWSASGRYVAYTELQPDTGFDIWILDLQTQQPSLFRGTSANETGASFSPDGTWVAYSSDESGSMQVYVGSFGGSQRAAASFRPVRVSTESGALPAWRADGSELYFLAGQTLMAVSLRVVGGNIAATSPHELFTLRRGASMGPPYAVSPDGKRFLVLRGSLVEKAPLTVRID
jgi:Tol biopolymer transport system component